MPDCNGRWLSVDECYVNEFRTVPKGWGMAIEPAGELAVREVVRDVITGFAPEELPLVDGLWRLDDDEVLHRLRRRRQHRAPLGFGLDDIAVLATPLVWIALDEAVRRITGTAVGGVTKRTKLLLRKVLRRREPAVTVPRLSPAQLEQVQQHVRDLALKSGFDEDKAKALAERVGFRLLVGGQEANYSRAEGADGGAEPRDAGA